jgi:hypothetical protein
MVRGHPVSARAIRAGSSRITDAEQEHIVLDHHVSSCILKPCDIISFDTTPVHPTTDGSTKKENRTEMLSIPIWKAEPCRGKEARWANRAGSRCIITNDLELVPYGKRDGRTHDTCCKLVARPHSPFPPVSILRNKQLTHVHTYKHSCL